MCRSKWEALLRELHQRAHTRRGAQPSEANEVAEGSDAIEGRSEHMLATLRGIVYEQACDVGSESTDTGPAPRRELRVGEQG